MDYEFIDISDSCNVGTECLPGEAPALGEQAMRGLPFTVGASDGDRSGNCYVALTSGEESVTLPVGKKAHNVIFAHRQMETEQDAMGPIGVHVADYVIRFENSEIHHRTYTRAIRDKLRRRTSGHIALRRGLSIFGGNRSRRRSHAAPRRAVGGDRQTANRGRPGTTSMVLAVRVAEPEP